MPTRILLVYASVFLLFAGAVAAQRVAVLAPDGADSSKAYALKLEAALNGKVLLLDDSLAKAAFDAAGFSSPYNLSLDDAKRVGQAIGCDFFVLAHAGVRRRSSFERPEYYEAYVALFLVSSRTGRLVSAMYPVWRLNTVREAEKQLGTTAAGTAVLVAQDVSDVLSKELIEKSPPIMEEPPEDGSSSDKFRAPIPFRRIKPEYTDLASSFDVTATVDLVVDLDAEGHIMRTQIMRWAGFGLDESVERAVRLMNWRPAERDSKFVPLRFLVRYNFKKTEKSPKN